MAKTSEWTQLLGEEFLVLVDEVVEELKEMIGWPPLGVTEVSPSTARRRVEADAKILADLFTRVGPERSVSLLKVAGIELLDEFGEGVVQQAMKMARRSFAAELGADGRESYVEGGE